MGGINVFFALRVELGRVLGTEEEDSEVSVLMLQSPLPAQG